MSSHGTSQEQDGGATSSDIPATPAPSGRPQTPQAPAPKPAASTLPQETPASSSTPTAAAPDISEFDPFATPAPSSSAPAPDTLSTRRPEPSTPRPRNRGARDKERDGAAAEPPFNFPGFLKDLRLKSTEPVARYLKSFLNNFAKKQFTVNEQIKLINDFLDFISEKMRQCEPWKSQSPAEFDNALEAMEKLVMNRLYNYTFMPQLVATRPITTDDLERDSVFAQRVRLFGWVQEKHLDVPEGETSQGFLGFAEQELLKINHYKAPRDKMICILNCCKVIFGLIKHTNGADSTSADAFIPILILVVLRANPDNMLSNVEYISRFRSPARLQGEAAYYLSSLTGAIAFIETMDASSLSNITQEEFEKNVETAIQQLPPSPSSSTMRTLPPPMSPFGPTTPGEEPARQLALTSSLAAFDNTRKFFQRTSTQMTEAVSRPLSAIGKIFDGMQLEEAGSDSGDDDDHDHDHDGQQSTPRRQRPPLGAVSPESPSARFAQMNLESTPGSGTGTPSRDPPEFSPEQLQTTLDMSHEAYAQARRANVQTLHQMFPALDEDILEAVLESCRDDLGGAIDTLLEM